MRRHAVGPEPKPRVEAAVLYGCLAHSKRGDTVCDNALVKPLTTMDEAVLAKLGKDVLRPAVVRALLDAVFAALEPTAVTTNVGDLTKALNALDKKIAHLSVAVEEGGALAPLVAKLKQRQTERDALLAAIGAADAVTQMHIDRRQVTRKVLAQVEAWRALVATDGRQFLREVLEGAPSGLHRTGTSTASRGKRRRGA